MGTKPETTEQRLYIGNIAHTLSEDDLQAVITGLGYGVDEIQIIIDRESGRSRGFGFVTLSPEVEIGDAIRELNGKNVGGRTLNVSRARPREERASAQSRGSRW